MTIKQLLSKAFLGGEWFVGYRRKGSADQFTIVQVPDGMWIADPFLYEADGEHYLFVELYEKKRRKAGIGYYQFVNGIPEYRGMILDQSYHMSYPCVFHYEGTHYMIPESSANHTVDLYRAERFPDKWVQDTTLIHQAKYVDTTVDFSDRQPIMLSYQSVANGWNLVQYSLDMQKRRVTESSRLFFEQNTGRPAGRLYRDERIVRPAQDCSRKYGEKLLLYQVDAFSPEYREHVIREISAEDLGVAKQYSRVHTINYDSCYEVVDLFREKIDLLHGVKIFIRQKKK